VRRLWRLSPTAAGRGIRDRPLVHPASGPVLAITVRANHCSVPIQLICRQVRALLNASDLIVFDGRTEVARHERLLAKGGKPIDAYEVAGADVAVHAAAYPSRVYATAVRSGR